MAGQEVTLDLPVISHVLTIATTNLSNILQDELRGITDNLSRANRARIDGNAQEQYILLSHANTARERFARTAQNYADTIEALFHVEEACKRENVVVDRSSHWSR